MKYYKLRLDGEVSYVKDCSAYAYVHETGKDGDNPHIHMYIATATPEQTIRSRVVKMVGKGNGKYSLKELEDEYPIEYLAYMLKEENWIKKDQYMNIPDDILEQVKNHQETVKSEMKKKKESKKTQLQKIKQQIQESIVDGKVKYVSVVGEKWLPMSEKWIIEQVVEYYKVNEILVREFQIISLVQSLSLCFLEGYSYSFVNRIQDKIK